jgi:hypothetical protein
MNVQDDDEDNYAIQTFPQISATIASKADEDTKSKVPSKRHIARRDSDGGA